MCDKHGDTVREHAYELLEACKLAHNLIAQKRVAPTAQGTWWALKYVRERLETAMALAEGTPLE